MCIQTSVRPVVVPYSACFTPDGDRLPVHICCGKPNRHDTKDSAELHQRWSAQICSKRQASVLHRIRGQTLLRISKRGAFPMNEQSNSKTAFDLEWYENGKLKRVRVGRIVVVFLIILMTALIGNLPTGVLEEFLK